MKPKNFPARKLMRQFTDGDPKGPIRTFSDEERKALESARAIRTKKYRAKT